MYRTQYCIEILFPILPLNILSRNVQIFQNKAAALIPGVPGLGLLCFVGRVIPNPQIISLLHRRDCLCPLQTQRRSGTSFCKNLHCVGKYQHIFMLCWFWGF